MNDFVAHGFLSGDSAPWMKDFDNDFQDWIGLYHEVNDEGMKMLLVAKQDGSSNQKILANQLAVRILTNYQAVYHLAKLGLESETRAIMRGLLEAVFVLQATEKKLGFSERFVKHSLNEHKKFLKDLADLSLLDGPSTKDFDALGKFDQSEHLSVWKIADQAEMGEFYKMQYARLCMHTHPSALGLTDTLKVNDQGIPTGTIFLHSYIDTDHNLMTAIGFMLCAIGSINRLFALNRLERIRELLEAHVKLGDKMQRQ